MKRFVISIMFFSAIFAPCLGFAADGEYHTLGVLGGASFPRALFGKVDLNLSTHFAVDYQVSLGFFWSIQQLDACYYFNRSEWSTYAGVGVQNWNFYGFSGSTNYNGILFGTGNSAVAVTGSFGVIYVAQSGFALDLNVAGDIFVGAPTGIQNRVIPEGNLALGYFF